MIKKINNKYLFLMYRINEINNNKWRFIQPE